MCTRLNNIVGLHSGVAVVGDFNRLPDGPLRNYPLRQVVRGSTRKSALLDKIYTNMSEWYKLPTIIAQIGSSDHRAVVMHPTGRGVRCEPMYKVDVVRSQDPNGKAVILYMLCGPSTGRHSASLHPAMR